MTGSLFDPSTCTKDTTPNRWGGGNISKTYNLPGKQVVDLLNLNGALFLLALHLPGHERPLGVKDGRQDKDPVCRHRQGGQVQQYYVCSPLVVKPGTSQKIRRGRDTHAHYEERNAPKTCLSIFRRRTGIPSWLRLARRKQGTAAAHRPRPRPRPRPCLALLASGLVRRRLRRRDTRRDELAFGAPPCRRSSSSRRPPKKRAPSQPSSCQTPT